MKKSRLFSLLCAFWPGDGEMYLGLMKRGLAIMVVFWGAIAIMSTIGLEMLLFALPVLWFYSFFDTLTLRNLDYYALTELQENDDYFFQDILGGGHGLPGAVQRYHVAIGGGLVVLGGLMLYRKLVHYLYFDLKAPAVVYDTLRALPSMVLSFGIIALGIWLVRGKRMPADQVEDYPRYGENHNGTEEKENDKRSA